MKIIDAKSMTPNGIKNIIFDWGGVLINLDYESVFSSLETIGIDDPKKLFTDKEANALFRNYELGKLTDSEFRDGIRNLSRMELSDDQIDNAWMAILLDIPTERIAMLKRLSLKYNLYLLSNTNNIHAVNYNKLLKDKHGINNNDLFIESFYSHELQLSKPDPQIFKVVIDQLNIKPKETLFIDDLESNAEGAASVGLNALFLNLKQGMEISEILKDW